MHDLAPALLSFYSSAEIKRPERVLSGHEFRKCPSKDVSFLRERPFLSSQSSSLLPSVCLYMMRSSMRTIPVAMVNSDSTERFRSAVSSKKR